MVCRRSANAQFAPPVATLTLLDEYMLSSALIIGLTVLAHALASTEKYAWLEPTFVVIHILMVLMQHAWTFGLRTADAARNARDLGFVAMAAPATRHARWQSMRRRVRIGQHALNVVRIFSAEKGRYVEVEASAIEQLEDSARVDKNEDSEPPMRSNGLARIYGLP